MEKIKTYTPGKLYIDLTVLFNVVRKVVEHFDNLLLFILL